MTRSTSDAEGRLSGRACQQSVTKLEIPTGRSAGRGSLWPEAGFMRLQKLQASCGYRSCMGSFCILLRVASPLSMPCSAIPSRPMT